MKNWKIDHSWTLFLDRDGVVNERLIGDYVKCIDEFNFLNKVPEAISVFSKIFKYIFVVTNQQGIGKGIMTEGNLFEIHNYMQDELEKAGGRIDQFYFAPELASDVNALRKPNSGMALKAAADFPGLEFSKAIMVGDSDSDIQFGKNLGMKTVRIRSAEKENIEADLTVDSLFEFAKLIVK